MAFAQDAASRADCARIVQESLATLGGLDVIVANAGWTKFTDFKDLHALSEQEWDLVGVCNCWNGSIWLIQLQSWAVNVKSNLHLLQEAAPTFNKNCDGGVVLMTSSVAVRTTTAPFQHSDPRAPPGALADCFNLEPDTIGKFHGLLRHQGCWYVFFLRGLTRRRAPSK